MKIKIAAGIAILLILSAAGIIIANMVKDAGAGREALQAEIAETEKQLIEDVFHDQGGVYMTPLEPSQDEPVSLVLRTKRYNVTRAQIQYTADDGVSWNTVNMACAGEDKTGYYELWEGSIPASESRVYYRFILGNKDLLNTVYYDTEGAATQEGSYTNGWQYVPGHSTPDWAKGMLTYSLVPDSFFNGTTENDRQISGEYSYTPWDTLRNGEGYRYGGDISGIISKIDYIKEFGADAVFTNPVWKSYHDVGYSVLDFNSVEGALGNEEDLEALYEALHESGLKHIGDVVTHMTDLRSLYFDQDGRWPLDGAFESRDSEWKDLFRFYQWPDNYMMTLWNAPATDLSRSIAKDIITLGEKSYLRKYARYYDGYRFDCGGWLWGTSDTDDLTALDLIAGIRSALRSEKDDFLIISEADWGNLNKGVWDSQWNINYMPKLQDYAKGLINETLMLEAMRRYELTVPRNVALCLTNMISDHDSFRVEAEDHMYNAALLIQMTYLGSPSIFYGEENGLKRENPDGVGNVEPFYSMDWNETNWNLPRRNMYKALGELRNRFSCVRTGAVNILDYSNADSTIIFGRWDENGAAVTVTSQNDDIITVKIPVVKCDIPDGTVMTDWLSGARYEVKDGMIEAEILPGGSVIVTGDEASSYRSSMRLYEIGDPSGADVRALRPASFSAEGAGSIDGGADSILLSGSKAFGPFALYGAVRGEGSGAFVIRDGLDADSACIAAVSAGGKLTVKCRRSAGAAIETAGEVSIGENDYIRIERAGGNSFSFYRASVEAGVLGKWEKLDIPDVSIPMNEKTVYGFAPLGGSVRFLNVTFEKGERVYSDNFDGECRNAVLDYSPAASIANGKLLLGGAGENSTALTFAPDGDWSAKTVLACSPSEGEYAGVVTTDGEGGFVIAGKTYSDGGPRLFIGKYTDGGMMICGSTAAPEGECLIQLQRLGAYCSAVFSADGKNWTLIGTVFANYSCERAGLLSNTKEPAEFDLFSFGDHINDGTSLLTPRAGSDIDTLYDVHSSDQECHYRFLSGDWAYADGGWSQSSVSGRAVAAETNNYFTDLRAEATIDILEGSGYAAMAFGLERPDAADAALEVRLSPSGVLELVSSGAVIAKYEAGAAKGLKIIVDVTGDQAYVYAGQNALPVISARVDGYKGGYAAFVTDGAGAAFRNFYIGSAGTNWYWSSFDGDGAGRSIVTFHSRWQRQLCGQTVLGGVGLTDFAVSAGIYMSVTNVDLPAKAGLSLCASEGTSAETDGVYLYLNEAGSLVLSIDGVVRGECHLGEGTRSVSVLLVKQNRSYSVFKDGETQPVITYEETFERGGGIAVFSSNASAVYSDIIADEIGPSGDYSGSKAAKNFAAYGEYVYETDFAADGDPEGFIRYYPEYGDYSVRDGMLRCENSSDWIAGVTYLGRTYSDFEMSFRLRINTGAAGWMSVGIRKDNATGNHNDTAFSMMVSTSGTAFFFESYGTRDLNTGNISGFEIGKWMDVKLVADGENVTAYINGQKVSHYRDTKFGEGLISFTSGMTDFDIDDLRIAPIVH